MYRPDVAPECVRNDFSCQGWDEVPSDSPSTSVEGRTLSFQWPTTVVFVGQKIRLRWAAVEKRHLVSDACQSMEMARQAEWMDHGLIDQFDFAAMGLPKLM